MIAVVVVALVAAIVVIVVRGSNPCRAQAEGPSITLTGVVGSESAPLLSDPDVASCLAGAGVRLAPPDRGGSLDIGNRGDLGTFQFAVPSSAPAAERLVTAQGDRGSLPLFESPMVVATYREVAETLAASGVATLGPDGQGTIDVAKLIDLVDGGAQWGGLPGNRVPSPERAVLLGTTDPADSNSASMFLALASASENQGRILTSTDQIDGVLPKLCPVFRFQGDKVKTSQDLFDHYLGGVTDTPMALVYEHQFRAARNAGTLTPDQVVLYPTHTVRSQYTLVTLPGADPAAADGVRRLGRELAGDPGVVERAVALGFRPVRPPEGSSPEPQPPGLVQAPSYPVLTELVNRVSRECA